MDLNNRLKTLISHKLVSLKLRFLYHFNNFLLNNLLKKGSSSLMIRLLSYKKSNATNRLTNFKMPFFKKNLYKFTFTSISIKFLNIYLYNQFILVNHDPFYSTIKSRLKDFVIFHKNPINLLNIHEKFMKSRIDF